MFDYDAELSRYHQHLCEAIDVQPSDTLLDIGCGTGQTTRHAAGIAVHGSALGVDVSEAMLTRARELAAAENLDNVHFEQADAQVHPFKPEHFTLGVSRFGTMFFTDAVEAFTNIRRALRPGARLVQLVWQSSDRQEWTSAIHRALTGEDPAPMDGGAFSLADPATINGVLTSAGFTDVSVTDLHEPIYYGPDPQAAVDAVRTLKMAGDRLSTLGPEETEQALDRLHTVMAQHTGTDGVWFDSRVWLVTAHR